MGDTIDLGCKRSGCVCSFIKRQESAIKAEDGSRDEPGPQIARIIGKAFRVLIPTNFFIKNHLGHETEGNK